MNVPVFSLDANFQNLYTTPVVHKYDVEYFLYIHIPVEISRYYEVFQLDQVSPVAKCMDMSFGIFREARKPWIRIISKLLDWTIGLHTYRLSLVNRISNDTTCLYFGYILQDNHPEQPYIYMRNCFEGD